MQRLSTDSTPENPARVPKGQGGAQASAISQAKGQSFYHANRQFFAYLCKNKSKRIGQPLLFLCRHHQTGNEKKTKEGFSHVEQYCRRG